MLRRTANNHCQAQAKCASNLLQCLLNLQRKFSRGDQNQSLPLVHGQALNHWDTKRQGFSRPCLGNPYDVFSFQRVRNNLMLYGRGRIKSILLQKSQEIGLYPKVAKATGV
ncbi:MAG: hypothetical protein COU35_04500 [Candidatus Magasanikbacteria bacterium CG10_big_fil_rev_8_21_14_0_10_47_10]|uniref:Uncharacterized protein n=1 Tax=Candidatus Magasanikbacteria bacterium CG10_big_fil_rev_8_21_14_0_10_47_10 TaxID=1974652 RepID=A0A2H0TPI3_9BACT|nr:MAG: hypothetical protein COU35_04500 [Candidatus Magasanikbacteria bacterium CG10_big_fil_rev_8_21_14_0_10_47_10]